MAGSCRSVSWRTRCLASRRAVARCRHKPGTTSPRSTSRLHGAAARAVFPAAHQPGRPPAVREAQRAVHVGDDGDRPPQAALRHPARFEDRSTLERVQVEGKLAQPGLSRHADTRKTPRGSSLPSTATGDVQGLSLLIQQHAPKRVFAQRVDVNRSGVGRVLPGGIRGRDLRGRVNAVQLRTPPHDQHRQSPSRHAALREQRQRLREQLVEARILERLRSLRCTSVSRRRSSISAVTSSQAVLLETP